MFNVTRAKRARPWSASVEEKETGGWCCRRLQSYVSSKVSEVHLIVPEQVSSSRTAGWSHVHWLEVWDVITVFLLLQQAYHIPFDLAVGFGEGFNMTGSREFLLLLPVPIFFTMDMFLQFFIAFGRHHVDLSEDFWETDCRKVAARYMAIPFSQHGRAGWFWIDLISVTAGWCCLTSKLDAFRQCHPHMGKVCSLKLVRILRLIRMLSMQRWQMFLARLHSLIAFPYYLIDLVGFMVVSTLACHWFACAWIVVEGGAIGGQSLHSENSWLSVLLSSAGDPCASDEDLWCIYILALYWSTMTLTGVGYGNIVPQNLVEYHLCTALMLVSGFIWAWVVGSVVSLLSNLDPEGGKFKHKMDDMNELMNDRDLPQELRVRLRSYMHEAKFIKRQEEQIKFLQNTLSRSLQFEIAQCMVNDHLLSGLYWAQASEVEDDARIELVNAFRPVFYPASEELILDQTILVISKGKMLVKGCILGRGDTYGHENILLTTDHLIDRCQPKTITSLSGVTLSKPDLVHVASLYPRLDHRIRKAQIKIALYRAVILIAHMVKLKKEGKDSAAQRNFSMSGHPPQEHNSFFEELSSRIADIHEGVHGAESFFESVRSHEETELEERFNIIDHRFDTVHQRFDTLSRRLDDMEQKVVVMGTNILNEISALSKRRSLTGSMGLTRPLS